MFNGDALELALLAEMGEAKEEDAKDDPAAKLLVRTNQDADTAFVLARDLLQSVWITAQQARWMLAHCPVLECPDLELREALLRTWRVELALHMLARVVDLDHFDLCLAVLSPEEQALLIHRAGRLAVWCPKHVDQPYTLDLRFREDRVVAKALVHLAAREPGECWREVTFSHTRGEPPVPGWKLKETWFSEDGMGAKGLLRVRYVSEPSRNLRTKKCDWMLRVALCAFLSLANPSLDEKEEFGGRTRMTVREYVAANLGECGITWNYSYNRPYSSGQHFAWGGPIGDLNHAEPSDEEGEEDEAEED